MRNEPDWITDLMSQAKIVSIFVGGETSRPMESVEVAHAVAGQGLEGDRYWQGNDLPSRHRGVDHEITLIESEAIEALVRDEKVPFELSESRRNLVTRGVALNHLVGQEFRVGAVRLKGIRLCEPCKHLEAMTRTGVLNGLLHRGGLRAQILDGGEVRVGDPVDTGQ